MDKLLEPEKILMIIFKWTGAFRITLLQHESISTTSDSLNCLVFINLRQEEKNASACWVIQWDIVRYIMRDIVRDIMRDIVRDIVEKYLRVMFKLVIR